MGSEKLSWQTVRQGVAAGTEFLLPRGTPGCWSERILDGAYEPGMVEVMAGKAVSHGVLLDVGAHIGYYSCVWLRLGGARSEALEPLPQNRDVIARVIARNHLEGGIRVHPCAASDTTGAAQLVVPGDLLGYWSMARLRRPGDAPGPRAAAGARQSCIEVQCRRIDDLVDEGQVQPPDLVKIDVEGAEASVIRGARQVLLRHRPWVLCEVHGIEEALSVTQSLLELGYHLRTLGKTTATMGLLLATCEGQG